MGQLLRWALWAYQRSPTATAFRDDLGRQIPDYLPDQVEIATFDGVQFVLQVIARGANSALFWSPDGRHLGYTGYTQADADRLVFIDALTGEVDEYLLPEQPEYFVAGGWVVEPAGD